jgi:hypothetical protein
MTTYTDRQKACIEQWLFVAMDDDRYAHLTYCADGATVKAAVTNAVFHDAEDLLPEHDEEIKGITENLIENGSHHFEGDAPLYLFRVANLESTSPVAVIPQGYALVPIEPTQAMLRAGNLPWEDDADLGQCYAAMVAAAPQPASSQVAVDSGAMPLNYVTALVKRMQGYCDSLAPPMARGLMAEAIRALLAAAKPVSVDAGGMTEAAVDVAVAQGEPTRVFVLPITVASLIDGAFLPTNPNRMRGAHPDVVAAAKIFKEALVAAKARVADTTPPTESTGEPQ